jgi:hypothetical protein
MLPRSRNRRNRPNLDKMSTKTKIVRSFACASVIGSLLLSIELNPKPPFPPECNLENKTILSYSMLSLNNKEKLQISTEIISKVSGGGSSTAVIDILQLNGEVENLFSGVPKKRYFDDIASKLVINSTESQPKLKSLTTGLNRLIDIVSASRDKAAIDATIVADVGSDESTLTNIKTAANKLQGEYCLHINVKGVDSKDRLRVATALSSLKSIQIDNPEK